MEANLFVDHMEASQGHLFFRIQYQNFVSNLFFQIKFEALLSESKLYF